MHGFGIVQASNSESVIQCDIFKVRQLGFPNSRPVGWGALNARTDLAFAVGDLVGLGLMKCVASLPSVR